jgi:hypothetical protein
VWVVDQRLDERRGRVTSALGAIAADGVPRRWLTALREPFASTTRIAGRFVGLHGPAAEATTCVLSAGSSRQLRGYGQQWLFQFVSTMPSAMSASNQTPPAFACSESAADNTRHPRLLFATNSEALLTV